MLVLSERTDLTRRRRSRRLAIHLVPLWRTSRSASAVDRDRAALLRRTGLALVHRDREHAVLEGGLDRFLVGVVRQVQDTLETAVGAFDAMEAALLLFLLLVLLAPYHQHVVVERDLDVLFLDAGNLQRNLVLLVGFLNVQRRLQHVRPVRRPSRHGLRRQAEASKRIVKEAVDLAMQLQDGTDGTACHRQVVALHGQRGSALLFFLFLLEPVPGSQLLEINIHVTSPNREDSVISFACSDEHCAAATSPDRLISAFHTLASPPSFCLLGSDH